MSRRNLFPFSALVLLTLFLAACGSSNNGGPPPPPPPPPPTVTLTTVVSGLSNPLGLQQPPGDNRFFVVEQRGTIRIIANGVLQAGNFLDIQSLTNFDGAEQGLLGLAFHPNYSTNRLFYVNYTRPRSGDPNNLQETVIAEFQTMAGDPNHADPASKRELLVIPQPFTNHKGGQLVFGPDNFLYLGLGDGGNGGDPHGNGQNLNVLLGKILRIGVDPPFSPGLQYAIPPDNPFAGGGGLPEIWSYGMRNPWRFSFERGGTRLFCGDVGQDMWEEVDLITKGGNFGWNVMEGKHCFNPSSGCDTSNKILPIFEYSHAEGGVAVIGGYVYRGAITGLANAYIYGDLNGKIWSLTEAPANTWTRTLLLTTSRSIVSFGQDSAGEVYVVDLGGSVLKLAAQ
jgi:glucose/arabinose dehydrogenase